MSAREARLARAKKRVLLSCGALALILPAAVAVLATTGVPDLTGAGGFPVVAYLAFAATTLAVPTIVAILVATVLTRTRFSRRTLLALGDMLPATICVIPAIGLLDMWVLEGQLGRVYFHEGSPAWVMALEALAYLLVSDFFFYWSHRALHTRALYKVHLCHHLQTAPTEPAAALALSPLDWHVEGILLFFAPVLVVEIQVGVWLGCGAFILLVALYNHSARMSWLRIPLINGALEHQYHHHRGRQNTNYSLIFTVWDRLFGTYAVPTLGEPLPWAKRAAKGSSTAAP
jgi:sterol desaturase/sphingolipid hydroxylase (fatty acid hydroxylase superfamily)